MIMMMMVTMMIIMITWVRMKNQDDRNSNEDRNSNFHSKNHNKIEVSRCSH
jgi:hypothetical protein